MYVCHTNQIGSACTIKNQSISCCKGKWYVKRFDPDTVENGHIYSSIKEENVELTSPFSVGKAEDFVGGFDNHLQSDNQSKKHSAWDITTNMR